nr:MAG TPA: hypothetical protein [Microviridae sp.]
MSRIYFFVGTFSRSGRYLRRTVNRFVNNSKPNCFSIIITSFLKRLDELEIGGWIISKSFPDIRRERIERIISRHYDILRLLISRQLRIITKFRNTRNGDSRIDKNAGIFITRNDRIDIRVIFKRLKRLRRLSKFNTRLLAGDRVPRIKLHDYPFRGDLHYKNQIKT